MSMLDILKDKPKEEVKEHREHAKDHGERTSKPGERYTENELMVRLKFIIGVCLAFTLIGIVFTVLYSIMFITQPLNAISPIDQKFFELIIPVATFLCGTLSGIMLAGSGKEAAMAGAKAAGMNGNGNGNGFNNYGAGRSVQAPGGYGQQNMQPRPIHQPMMQSIDDGDLLPGQSPKMHD